MNPLEYIQQYTKQIGEAAIVLKQLGQVKHPLPNLESLDEIKRNLLLIHPADITAKLAWEDNVESKRKFIIDSLRGFLEIDAGVGAVMIDGVEYDYWDGMNEKLAALDKAEVEAYTNLIVGISNIIHDSTNGMRNDINYLFNEVIFEDRNVLADTAEVRHDEAGALNLPAELDTERARKYFKRAIDAGFMCKTDSGYKWLYGGSNGQVRLGYFISKTYGSGRRVNKLERLFDVQKLSASITQAETYNGHRADVLEWRTEIDTMLSD